MTRQRIGAIVLLLIAFLALVARFAFPFMDGISGVTKTAIALVGAACALLGVYLWLRKTPTAKP
jgi:hypothetical protein